MTRPTKKQRQAVQSEYQDIDGYWMPLKPGWSRDGIHEIHADTRKEAYLELCDVEPCSCSEECQKVSGL